MVECVQNLLTRTKVAESTIAYFVTRDSAPDIDEATHNSIGTPSYLSPRIDPWVFLVIPRTYFRANIPDDEGGSVLAYNLMMLAIVGVCLAAIHFDVRRGGTGLCGVRA